MYCLEVYFVFLLFNNDVDILGLIVGFVYFSY